MTAYLQPINKFTFYHEDTTPPYQCPNNQQKNQESLGNNFLV